MIYIISSEILDNNRELLQKGGPNSPITPD